MLVVGDAVYAMLIGPSDARLWRADIGAAGLDRAVDAIRLTISAIENGRRVTYPFDAATARQRSEEHTSELQSLMRISYAVFCLTKKQKQTVHNTRTIQ